MPSSVSPSGSPRAPAPGRDRQGGSGGVSRFRAAPVLLALATAKEYRAALSPLGAPAPPPPGRAALWRRGGRDWLVLITGVGPVAAAMAVGRAIGEARGELAGVVNLGICGSFDLAVAPLGAVTATTAAIFPEYGLHGDNGVEARGIAFPQAVIDGCDVYDRLDLDPAGAATAMGLTLPADVVAGTGLTVAGVTASPAREAALRAAYAPLTEAMEGFGAALAAACAGLPFVELRSVSNRVGARPPGGWDLPGAFAALGRAAAVLLG